MANQKMANQKIEIVIPDGWEFDGFGTPGPGQHYITDFVMGTVSGRVRADGADHDAVIVKRAKRYRIHVSDAARGGILRPHVILDTSDGRIICEESSTDLSQADLEMVCAALNATQTKV